MKIIHVLQQADAIRLDVVCNKCGEGVSHSYTYCPKCGRKLLQLPLTIDLTKLCGILTNELRRDAERKEHDPQTDFALHTPSVEAPTIACPRGRTNPKECEFLDRDGKCLGIVYPTYPPQHDKCHLLQDPRSNIPVIRETEED